jgi:hypothetical protein
MWPFKSRTSSADEMGEELADLLRQPTIDLFFRDFKSRRQTELGAGESKLVLSELMNLRLAVLNNTLFAHFRTDTSMAERAYAPIASVAISVGNELDLSPGWLSINPYIVLVKNAKSPEEWIGILGVEFSARLSKTIENLDSRSVQGCVTKDVSSVLTILHDRLKRKGLK